MKKINGEKLNVFFLRSGKVKDIHSQHSITHCNESPGHYTKAIIRNKRHGERKI